MGIACRAALTLHKQDRANVWRRLIAIAFEDVGPADIDVALQTVAAAVSPGWRASCGEDRAVVSIVSRLAAEPKDRSADYLMWIAAEHPDQRNSGGGPWHCVTFIWDDWVDSLEVRQGYKAANRRPVWEAG